MRSSRRRFSLDGSFPLPEFAHHVLDGRHLFIAAELPAWVVVDAPEAEAIERMARGASLAEAERVIASHSGVTDARNRLRDLVTMLATEQFVQTGVPDDQSSYVRLQCHVTNRCNLRCPHCYVASGRPFEEELSYDEWVDIFELMRGSGRQVHVAFSGGEPLTVPWIADLVRYAKAECRFDTAMITNGLLWTPARVSAIAPYLDYVAVSLDGASQAVHDAIRGAGNFRRTVATLHALNEAGLRIVLNVTLMRHNRDDLVANLYPLVCSLPFHVDIDVASFITEGRGAEMPQQPLGRDEFQATLGQIVRPFVTTTWRPLPMSKRLSCGYGTAFAIYANGDVSPCLTPRFIRGNVRRDGTRAVFTAIAAEAAAASVERLPLCRTCDVRYICGGRCHLNHLIPLGRMEQNDCSYEYRDTFYRSLVRRFDVSRQPLEQPEAAS